MKRLALLLLLAGCDTLPRDTDGTLEQVQAAHRVRVGLVADPRLDRAAAASLVGRVAETAGAQASVSEGAAEPLLAALDQGQLDLVVATWDKKTPWATEVTLTPPIARHAIGDTALELRGAVRNGENKWAMLVERAARATAKARGVE